MTTKTAKEAKEEIVFDLLLSAHNTLNIASASVGIYQEEQLVRASIEQSMTAIRAAAFLATQTSIEFNQTEDQE